MNETGKPSEQKGIEPERTVTTLSLIEKGDEVLLAMKKRGFGEGWWNGYGGKVDEGETVEEAMTRELEEESELVAKKWRERGVIEFFFHGTGKIVECHIFEVTDYEGEPKETEEMRPQWFKKDEVPYQQMWPADREWLPMFFEGKDFKGKATFDSETKKFLEADVQEIKE